MLLSADGAPALDALEAVLLAHVAPRPALTVLQLQRAAGALAALEAPAQLAAAALLLRGGFWAAALMLDYGGERALAADALGGVAALLRAGLALEGDDEVRLAAGAGARRAAHCRPPPRGRRPEFETRVARTALPRPPRAPGRGGVVAVAPPRP